MQVQESAVPYRQLRLCGVQAAPLAGVAGHSAGSEGELHVEDGTCQLPFWQVAEVRQSGPRSLPYVHVNPEVTQVAPLFGRWLGQPGY